MFEMLLRILLWLFVMNIGIAFGAGLFEGRITFANWLTSTSDGALHWNAERARSDNTGLRFWVFVTTVPLTLLAAANLISAWFVGELRLWWLTAAIAVVIERVLTFVYFIPTMVRLLAAADSPQSVAIAVRWERLNHVRHLITLAAWLSALQAFGLR